MQEKYSKTLLPFGSYEKAENGKFDDEVEKASAFCLAELSRAKGGGFFKKQPSEKMVFVAKVYYPFWIVSFRERALLFDGLNISSHTLKYSTIPDIQTFKDNMNASDTRHAFSTFLSNNIKYFQVSDVEQSKVVEGIIPDLDFQKEFMDYIKQGKVTDNPVVDAVLVSPAFNEEQIRNSVKELDITYDEFAKKLEEINTAIKLLNAKTQTFLDDMRKEKQEIEDKFSGPIKAAENALAENKAQINKAYTDKITEVSSRYEQESVAVRKEIIILEKTRDNLNNDIDRVEIEIKNATINKDDKSEQNWKEKRNELKKQLPEIPPQIKEHEEKVQTIEENKKKELFELQQANEAELKEASKNLSELESARDAEQKICQEEMEKIEDLTSKISGDIDKLSKMMDAALADFDSLGIKQGNLPPLLVYMPFYLFCYLLESNRRFSYIAPSIVSTRDISSRLKAIGKKQITQIFQPRSQRIVSILNKFLRLLEEDVAFQHEITEACNKVDLPHSKNQAELIKKGLDTLKADGWLSESEFEAFRQVIP